MKRNIKDNLISTLFVLISLNEMKIISMNLFNDLGVNEFGYLLIFIISFLLSYIFIPFSYQYQRRIFETKKIDLNKDSFNKRPNIWFAFTISILIVASLFSFNLYNSYVRYSLPFSFDLDIQTNNTDVLNSVNSPLYVYCYSENGERNFVLERKIYCLMNISYNENFTYHLSRVEQTYFRKDNSQETQASTMSEDQINDKHNYVQYWNIDIPIDRNFTHALIRLSFGNGNSSYIETNKYWINPPEILSEEEYKNRSKEPVSLWLTAVSIFFFSLVGVIKNLMDILHYNFKRQK